MNKLSLRKKGRNKQSFQDELYLYPLHWSPDNWMTGIIISILQTWGVK